MGMEEKCFILIHCFRLRSCLSLELYLQRYWGKHTNSSETESKPSSYIYVILLYMEEFPTGKSQEPLSDSEPLSFTAKMSLLSSTLSIIKS